MGQGLENSRVVQAQEEDSNDPEVVLTGAAKWVHSS
jgi:hypothetical protein